MFVEVACLTQPDTYTKTNVFCYSVSLGMWHNTLGSDNTWMVCYNNALNNIMSIDKYNYNYKLPHTSVRMIRNQSNRRFHKMVGLGEVRFANIGCQNIWLTWWLVLSAKSSCVYLATQAFTASFQRSMAFNCSSQYCKTSIQLLVQYYGSLVMSR